MECSNKIYHHNDFGFARKCTCQGAVHVCFGNISLLLRRPQVNDLSAFIREALLSECNIEDPDERSIYIPTNDPCLMFAMTFNEMRKIAEILEQTLLMMEVDDALSIND